MISSPTEQLKIVIVGHVDHGKSTFVGRLFYDTGSLPEGKLEQLQKASDRRGVPFEWANLMDALQSERDQNITIDTAQIWFHTRKRQYVIIDAPGHKEFLKNMVTGAASAEAALLLIDAHEGVQENSRRHGYLLNLLGIRQIAVLVNKMDLEGYSQARFAQIEREYRAYLKEIGVEPKIFIPIAARHGDNIAARSANMPWWQGPTVLETLDEFNVAELPKNQPLRFPIQDVYRFDERRILAGRVESGTLRVGDRLIFFPSRKVSTVKTIERWNTPSREYASAGESVGVTLTEQIFVERGAVAALETAPPYELTRFKVRLFWLGRAPFRKGRLYKLKLATQEVDCEIDFLEKVIDASTLETVRSPGRDRGSRASVGGPPADVGAEPPPTAGQRPALPSGEEFVGRHEVAELYLRTKRPVAFDTHSEIISTGRFVVVDGFDVAGGGIIVDDNYPRRTADGLHKTDPVYSSHGKVTAEQRCKRNGYTGCVIWLTGVSGSGKSAIATELERELFNLGKQAYVLDGDNVRHGLCSDLGFSAHDHKENIRRVGEAAKLFADAGFVCVTALISPFREGRVLARGMVNEGRFIEVYINCPPEVREQRDASGRYANARDQEITDVSASYEPPEAPEIELRTDKLSVPECVNKILDYLHLKDMDTEVSI